MDIKVKDFLKKWSGDWRIENKQEGVICDFPEGLSQEILNMNIHDIKLSAPWNSDQSGEMVIIVDDLRYKRR